MPVNPKTKFNEPTGLTGEWTTQHSTLFWHADSSLSVKLAIEKMCANLLKHDPESPDYPTYICPNAGPPGEISITLRLEAVFPTERLYSLHLVFKGSRNWLLEAEFLEKSKSVFDYWCTKLKVPTEEIPWAQASPVLLEQEIRSTLAVETEAASKREDPVPIAAVQQKILASIRSGYMFRQSHKEGNTRIYFDGTNFVRLDEGEYPDFVTYPTEAEFLTAIRHWHDWKARHHTYPHSPPELEVWRFIQSELMRQANLQRRALRYSRGPIPLTRRNTELK